MRSWFRNIAKITWALSCELLFKEIGKTYIEFGI